MTSLRLRLAEDEYKAYVTSWRYRFCAGRSGAVFNRGVARNVTELPSPQPLQPNSRDAVAAGTLAEGVLTLI